MSCSCVFVICCQSSQHPLPILFRNPWEGVNLLPFIDIQLLKDTIAKHCPDSKLSADERRRNSRGDVVCYRYDLSCTDTVPVPVQNIGLSEITGCLSSKNVIGNQLSRGVAFKPELIKGTVLPYPGYPTLNVLPIESVELARVGLNCFGGASKYPNTILSLYQMPELPPLEILAQNVLGKSVFVNWPMMHEGRVMALTNEEMEIRLVKGQHQIRRYNHIEKDRWLAESDAMVQTYHVGNGTPGSGGIVIGDVKVRLRLVPLQGMKTNPANGSKKKWFGQQEADVPLQLALLQAPAPDPRFIERGPLSLAERFPVESFVVLTKGKYRGCKGVVAGIVDDKNIAVKVQTLPAESPFGLAIARSVQESYISSADAARTLKIDGRVFGKITGRLQFEQDKYDLGLNLKGNNGTCVVGYTRKKVLHGSGDKKPNKWLVGDSLVVIGSSAPDTDDSDERIVWEYTPKAIRLIESYRQKFPQLFAALKKIPDEKKYDANKVFGPNGQAWLPVIRSWLDTHETAKIPRTPVTTESMSYDAIAAVQKAADVRSLAVKKAGYPKDSLIKIPGNALYREGATGATDVLHASDLNNNDAPRLGDRIVNLCADGVPFGARGTVVAIHEAATTGSVEVIMDEEFVCGTTLQGACSNFRGKLCLWAHLLKVEPDHANMLVDKMVPKGSGQAAVKKLLSNIERQVSKNMPQESKDMSGSQGVINGAAAKKSGGAKVEAAKISTASKSPMRADSADRDRAASASRGKQGVWKEARGPPKEGTWCKDETKRVGKSGIARWKALMKSQAARDTDSQLKSLLGVGVTPSRPEIPLNDATSGLKALLGVNLSSNATAPVPQQSRMPTAAEKLLQLMANKQNGTPGMQGMNSYPGSGFNFTYVTEGEEAKMPPPMHSFASGLPPPTMHMQAYDAPSMHVHPYSASPALFMPPNGPVASHIRNPSTAPTGPSLEQFPPLGAVASPAAVAVPLSPIVKETLPTVPDTAFSIVPSVVSGKI